jgi:RecA-family ATPase
VPDLIAAVEAKGVNPGLIVVDTIAKVIGAAEENGAGMAAFLWNAEALRRHFDCLVLPVHHVGHDNEAQKRPRGHSSLTGALDVQLLCERPDGAMTTTISVQKEKDEAAGLVLTAHLSRVVLYQRS